MAREIFIYLHTSKTIFIISETLPDSHLHQLFFVLCQKKFKKYFADKPLAQESIFSFSCYSKCCILSFWWRICKKLTLWEIIDTKFKITAHSTSLRVVWETAVEVGLLKSQVAPLWGFFSPLKNINPCFRFLYTMFCLALNLGWTKSCPYCTQML